MTVTTSTIEPKQYITDSEYRISFPPTKFSVSDEDYRLIGGNRTPKKQKLWDIRNKLFKLQLLENGWDDFSALRPNVEVVQLVDEFLSNNIDELEIPNIVPDVDGGIQLEWHTDNLTLEIIFTPRNSIGYFFIERAEKNVIEVEEIETQFEIGQLSKLIAKLNSEINSI